MLPSLRLLWAMLLFSKINADSTSSASESPAITAAPMANSSHFSIPIYCSYSQEYFIKVANEQGQSAPVRIDYLQPDLWVLDGQHMLECDSLFTVLDEISDITSWPSEITQDHRTYDAEECYWQNAFFATETVTTTASSATVTTVEVQSTGGSFYLDYANGISATGISATADISMSLAGGKELVLPDYEYLLATQVNRYIGALGLALYPHKGGLLSEFVDMNMTSAHSYSIFYFNNTSESSKLAGYLLPGSVDKSLYTGDLYSFPLVPFIGWGSLDASLPIISLDDIEMESLSTDNKAKIYDEGPFSVVIDPLLDYTYLPLSAIVNIALQTNAFYSSSQGFWVVKCSNIYNSNAVLNLNIGPLSLKIPLTSILKEGDDSLKFASGEPACMLNLFPSDSLGYPCIGSSMLRFIYMAMDNEGQHIALANSNQSLDADEEIENRSAEQISSGYIPFATTHSNSPSMETFTFYKQNYTSGDSIPARLSQVHLNSDGVYITGGISYSATNSASAAQAASTTGGANVGVHSMAGSASCLMLIIALVGSLMGISFV